MNLTSKTWCDLVFEGRNKSFGAYRLRMESGKRHLIALGFGTAVCAVVVLYLILANFVDYSTTVRVRQVRDISMLKPAENKKHLVRHGVVGSARANEKGKAKKETVPIIAEDNLVTEEAPSAAEGTGTGLASIDYADSTALDTTATLHNAVNANDRKEDFQAIAQLPEYPGGMVAFMKWITANMKYPTAGRNNDGLVIVQFIVKKDGAISELKIVRSLNPQCDNEVLRVMRMMPKWKPGTENGRPVMTQMVIPINFKS